MVNQSRQHSFRSRRAIRHLAGALYRGVFASSPHPYLVLTPELEIVDANEAYLSATMRTRDMLAGRDMFDAFPDNPALEGSTAVRNLKSSLSFALSRGVRDVMPLQRYDVTDPDGVWQMRFWRPVNWPTADEDGKVIALVHHVTDATGELPEGADREGAFHSDDLISRAEASCAHAARLRDKVRADIHAAKRGTQLRAGVR